MIEVGTRSRARLALVLVCAGLFPDAMDGAEPAAYELHIASQPLDSALQEFARQSGIQVLFLSYLTDGQRAPALDGTYTVDVALTALLAHSTLTFRWINARTIQITQLRRPTDSAK
jgi:iron complex outermembrane recepter protein